MNLGKFYNLKEKKFSVDLYRHATRIWTIVLEISVTMAPIPEQYIAASLVINIERLVWAMQTWEHC